VTASGCGTTVKDWGHLLGGTPDEAAAQAMGGLARDVSEVLNEMKLPELPPNGLKVAYHSACSLQHGQRVKIEPMQLLKRAGFSVVQPRDSHLCCGSAGTYTSCSPRSRASSAAARAHAGGDGRRRGGRGQHRLHDPDPARPRALFIRRALDWAYGGAPPPHCPENSSRHRTPCPDQPA
jgi:glycolate oxidase iron-sulfur subunit